MPSHKWRPTSAQWTVSALVLGIAAVGYVAWPALSGPAGGGPPTTQQQGAAPSKVAVPAEPASTGTSSSTSARAEPNSVTAPGHGASAPARVNMVDWGRFPGGLMPASAQALREKNGRAAYELVGLIDACKDMPERLERTRQDLTEMQTQRILKPSDQRWTSRLLDGMQQDLAQCQALSGDRKALRRQLLEVALLDQVDGAGMRLYLEGLERPDVLAQVLREAEAGDGLAFEVLAEGLLPMASPLQRDAARDALVRGAQDPALNADPIDKLQRHLRSLERHVAVEVARADPGNAAKAAAADTAYVGGAAPKLQPSTDPQVRALADHYLAVLKKRMQSKQEGS